MSKELIAGEYCLAGDNKVKRIYLTKLYGKYFCVQLGWEEAFNTDANYVADTWDICTPIPEEEYNVIMSFEDGTCERTLKYFTEREFEEFGFPSSCSLEQSTRRLQK